MKIGFTGTQVGMTDAQKEMVDDLLGGLFITGDKNYELHHGDCIGADYEAATLARESGYFITAHPPSDTKKRAYFKSDAYTQPKPYLERNYDIVDATGLLVATPKQNHEVLRSGTWATVRYARKRKKPIVLVYPDGSAEQE